MPENLNKTIVFFDLDLTITNKDTLRIFINKYYLQSFSRIYYSIYIIFYGILRKFRLISLKSFKEISLVALKNKTKDEIYLFGKEFFYLYLINQIRPKAIMQINSHLQKGDIVYIISASPDIFLKEFCNYLKCDGYLCTDLEYIDKIFTGKIKGLDCLGEEKILRIKNNIKYKKYNKIFAYTDHESDIPLLKFSNNPKVVNPTIKLKEYSMKNNWEVLNW